MSLDEVGRAEDGKAGGRPFVILHLATHDWPMKNSEPAKAGAWSRRTFLKSLGTTAVATAAAQAEAVATELEEAGADKAACRGRCRWP